jgi:uncharacterized Zn finger protein
MASLGVDGDERDQLRRQRDAGRLRAAGRVMSLRADPGGVEGRVQGSHARPHLVELRVDPWTDDEWHAVGELLGRQARHYARLLAGQLPDQFDAVLTGLGLSLVPRPDEWTLRCTCTETVPCTHQMAVWLEARERLEDDPYLITRLRGRSREQLLAEIRDQRASGSDTVPLDQLDTDGWSRARVHPSEVPLPPVRRPTTAAGPLRMLGEPPGWSGPTAAHAMFTPAVVTAADRARRLLDAEDPAGSAGAAGDGSGDVL